MNAAMPDLPASNPRARWLEARRLGIGGSDVAPIMGLSPWRTALDVYEEKLALREPQEDNEAMIWGRALEGAIRRQYEHRTGRFVSTPDAIVSPRYPFMRANLDGLTDDGRVLEIKTARTADGWGEPGTDEIPQAYLLQVQHYMLVTGCSLADVAVLIGGSDYRTYEVAADHDIHQILIEVESDFWHHVVIQQPPEPVTLDDALRRYGSNPAAGRVEADADTVAAVTRLKQIRVQLDALEAEEGECKAAIVKALADRGDTLAAQGVVLATWKLAKAPKRFDAKAFQSAHPDLHAQFTVAGEPSRRLLIK